MDNFAFNKALNHFNINEDEFMAIYHKYEYNQITIEEHYAKEKVMTEIIKWLSEDEDNTVIMELKIATYYSHNNGWCEDCKEINVTMSFNKEICYAPDLTYDWGEKPVYLEEHEVNFENVSKLNFEDSRGIIVKTKKI